jgi:hypothetical protein
MLAVVVSCVALTGTAPGPAGACTDTVMSGVVKSPGASGPGSPNVIDVLPLPSVIVPVTGVPLLVVSPLVWIVPGMNVPPPLSEYVLDKFSNDWIFTAPPSALLGSVAEPPGNNTWKVPALATSVGASSANVSVCICVPIALWHATVNVCDTSTAPAVPPNGTNKISRTAAPNAPMKVRLRRFDPSM